MKSVIEFLLFKRMMGPVLLQILFWAAIGGTVYGGVWLLVRGNWAGWMALIFGVILVRFIFELGILAFRNYQAIAEIRDEIKKTSVQ